MKEVTMKPEINDDCIGCETCVEICPVMAIEAEAGKVKVDFDVCRGCGNCEQRCPVHAVKMIKREEPFVVTVDVQEVDQDELKKICRKAKFHPKQLVCYCTGTRAEEVAAAILKGAETPAEISLLTGIRTGCKVECIQPILRLLKGAGITPEAPEGIQWYGKTVTAWEVSENVKKKYEKRGFRFEDDRELLDDVVETKGGCK